MTNKEKAELLNNISEKRKGNGRTTQAMFKAYPVGSYEDFKHKVDFNSCQNGKGDNTFGILIADARQSESREYLLNYLEYFHRQSIGLFDFYVPGFTTTAFGVDESQHIVSLNDWYKNQYITELDGECYYFDEFLFARFIEAIRKELGIQYTFNPMLILMEMKPGHWGEARRVIFELDNFDTHGVRRSGEFFCELLEITKSVISLEDITRMQRKLCIKGKAIDRILECLDNTWIQAIKNTMDDIKRYRITR